MLFVQSTGLQQKRVYTSLGSSCPTCVHQSPWQSRDKNHWLSASIWCTHVGQEEAKLVYTLFCCKLVNHKWWRTWCHNRKHVHVHLIFCLKLSLIWFCLSYWNRPVNIIDDLVYISQWYGLGFMGVEFTSGGEVAPKMFFVSPDT